jgi:hypothetical protein
MMDKMLKMMPAPARKMMAKMPGPMGKKAKKLKRKDKKGKGKPMGVDRWGPVAGSAQTAQPVRQMKHGGVVHKTPDNADSLSRHHNRYKIT